MGINLGAGGVKTASGIYVGAGGVKPAKSVHIGVGDSVKKVWPMTGKNLFQSGKDYGDVGANMHTMRWRNSNSSGSGYDYWRTSSNAVLNFLSDTSLKLDFGYNAGTSPNYSGSSSIYEIYIAYCWTDNKSLAVPAWVLNGLNQYTYKLSCSSSHNFETCKSVIFYNSLLKRYLLTVAVRFDNRVNRNSSSWNSPTLSWSLK